jgi:ABC-type transport system involved in cytochrome c biogenesis permease subunit
MWLRLALAAGLAAETVWLVTSGRLPWSDAWPLAALAYLFVLLAALSYSLRRSLRRIVAVPVSAAPPSSAPPVPGASSSP